MFVDEKLIEGKTIKSIEVYETSCYLYFTDDSELEINAEVGDSSSCSRGRISEARPVLDVIFKE